MIATCDARSCVVHLFCDFLVILHVCTVSTLYQSNCLCWDTCSTACCQCMASEIYLMLCLLHIILMQCNGPPTAPMLLTSVEQALLQLLPSFEADFVHLLRSSGYIYNTFVCLPFNRSKRFRKTSAALSKYSLPNSLLLIPSRSFSKVPARFDLIAK